MIYHLYYLNQNEKLFYFLYSFTLIVSTSNHRNIPPNFCFFLFQVVERKRKKKQKNKINRYPNIIKRTHAVSVDYF